MNLFDIFINNFQDIYKSTIETIDMLFSSMLIGILIGIPLGLFIVLSSKKNIATIILSFIVNIIRSIPFLILIVIISPLTFMLVGKSYGTQASKVPLSLMSITLIIRLTEQTIMSLPNNLTKLSKALGATKIQTIINFYLKEGLSNLILGLTTITISVLSYSTVVGVMAGGGLGDLALRYGLHQYNYQLLIVIVIIMVILVQLIQIFGNILSFYYNKEKYKGVIIK